MLYQTKRNSEKVPVTINVLLLLALGGCLLAAVQSLFIVLQGDILCLNEGCEIVEKLTTVPPILFNVAGSFYFLTIFLALWLGARNVRGGMSLARLLLLAGMTAEGVLVGFQYYVAEVFCSYCLIIFSLIALLNLLMGWRQMLAAVAVFGSVLIAFSSLEFTSRSESEVIVLENGIYGSLENKDSGSELYLLFSSTCPHCEDIIETIDEEFSCSLHFNPIDILAVSPLPELVRTAEYSPGTNRRFLKNLGLTEIPVLVAKGGGEIRVLKGKQKIQEYLDGSCRDGVADTQMSSEVSGESSQGAVFPYISPAAQDEACSVDVDCEEPPVEGNVQQ